jgi:hypothetical protein
MSSGFFCEPVAFLIVFCQIHFMSGITFMVDERGQKTAAVIDLRKHEQLWEDFHDSLLAESRESLESVRQAQALAEV